MSWQDDYFQRVRPVVGEVLRARRVAFWDLGTSYVVAAALAQTGIFRQVYFDEHVVADGEAFARSLGRGTIGAKRTEALQRHICAHNSFEQSWAFETHPQTLMALQECLREDPPDLLVARLDAQAPALLEACRDAGIPIVMLHLPDAAVFDSAHLLWHPGAGIDADALADLSKALATHRRLPEDATTHFLALDAEAMTLGLARWLLAMDRPLRPDLAAPISEQGKAVLLRGEASWPWAVRFARPDPRLLTLFAGPPRFRPPAAFLGRDTVLVLGLGTASLFCAEAGLFARRMVLLDCKEVSTANPVRQVYGTDRIGQPKGRALAEILAERWGPQASWQREDAGELTWLRSPEQELAYGELRLSRRERGSLERFRQILDATQPTLALVAMGRSKDDNFLATAELRRRGIRHITPTAFPGVSHFKHIITDGADGPCYDCLQGHLAIDGGVGPTLSADERELYYGGTQPATLAETLPSATSLLRLGLDLALPSGARPPYLRRELVAERNCFVGANRVERSNEGSWLYGVDQPFRLVTYGIEHLVGSRASERCPCGRVNVVKEAIGPEPLG